MIVLHVLPYIIFILQMPFVLVIYLGGGGGGWAGGGTWGLTSNDPGNENFNCFPCVMTSSFPKRKKFAFFGRYIRGLLTVHVNVITFESL